jgi:hypothetical protein
MSPKSGEKPVPAQGKWFDTYPGRNHDHRFIFPTSEEDTPMPSTDKFNFGHAVSAFVHNFHPGDPYHPCIGLDVGDFVHDMHGRDRRRRLVFLRPAKAALFRFGDHR